MMLVRGARQEDKEALWQIQTQAIRHEGPSHYSSEQVEAWAGGITPEESHSRAMERFADAIEQQFFLVAADTDGVVTGFAGLDRETGEVASIYVHPDWLRQGIGRQLMDALEAEASRIGLTRLHLRASLNAIPFYERMGFAIEQEMIHRMRSGVEMPCAVMTKDLSAP